MLFPQQQSYGHLRRCSGGNPSATGFVDGVVYFNGGCIAATTTTYIPAGPVTLLEFPFPGWVFYGWQINNTFVPGGATGSYTLNGPATFTPLFSIAKRVHLMTNPPGLQVLVDRSLTQTPPIPSANGATCNPVYNLLPPAPPPGLPGIVQRRFRFASAGQARIPLAPIRRSRMRTGIIGSLRDSTNGIGPEWNLRSG